MSSTLPPLSPPEPPRVFGAPALHTDGELVAVGIASDGVLWSVEEPGELRGWDLHSRRLLSSRPLDGAAMLWTFNWAARLLASAGRDVAVWEVASGAQLAEWGVASWVSAVAFQPGAAILATGHEDGSVRVWDWAEQREVAEFRVADCSVSAVAFSLDGTRLAFASEDKLVHVFDLASRKQLGTLVGHKDRVPALAWHPDNVRLYSAGWDTTVRVWDTTTFEPVILLNSHATQVHALALSADGKLLASADSANVVHIWDTDANTEVVVLREPAGEMRCLAFTPDDGRGNLSPAFMAWAGADRVIHLWDSRHEPGVSGSLDGPFLRSGVAVSPDGSKLYGLGGGTELRGWDTVTGEATLSLENNPALRAFALSPDGGWIAGGRLVTDPDAENRSTLSLYDATTGKRAAICTGQQAPITVLAFDPTSKLLASGGLRSTDVWLWRVPTGEPEVILPDAVEDCSVEAIAFQPGGSLLLVAGIDYMATSGRDGQVALWDVAARKKVQVLEYGAYVVTTTVTLDKQRWAKRRSVGRGGATAAAFHPSGKCVACAGLDRVVRLWDLLGDRWVLRDEREGSEPDHDETVTALAFSPDGRYLATAGDDGVLRLVDLNGFQPVSSWLLDNAVKSLAFSADSRYVYTSNANTSCYEIEVETLLES